MKELYNNIHIFGNEEVIFIKRLLDFFSDNNSLFGNDHHVVTPYAIVYNELQKIGYNNLIYDPYKSFDHNFINYYCSISRRVFVHAMPPISDAIFIKNKYNKKIVWRSWGHDVGYDATIYRSRKPKDIIRYFVSRIWAKKVRKFELIGIANYVDGVDIIKRFGSVKTLKMPYPIKDFQSKSIKPAERTITDTINIMVGHSGQPEDNHISIIKMLEHFGDKNIHIHLVLAYGNNNYINTVLDYTKSLPITCSLYTKLMPLDEYQELLNMMDVVILDGKKSYALGNISVLMELHKKIYLNREGVLHLALDQMGVFHGCTDTLNHDCIEDLLYNVPAPISAIEELRYPDYNECLSQWKAILRMLKL